MQNSDRFLTAFNLLEEYLRKEAQAKSHESFSRNVHVASQRNPRVRRNKETLLEFAQLRNAIVHGPSGEHVLAEPNVETTADIERLAELIIQPPPVSQFMTRNVKIVQARDSMRAALALFRKETFSQIPVYDGGRFTGLLTTTAVVRWISAHVDDGLDLNGAIVVDVLTRDKDYKFLHPDDPADLALDAFEERLPQGQRLRAVLVSENGKPDGRLVGILTVWDLPAIYRRISN